MPLTDVHCSVCPRDGLQTSVCGSSVSARFGDRILPGGDMFETHRAFLEWAAAYDDNTVIRCQKNHDAWQKTLPCPVLGLDGTLPVDTLVDAVLSELNKGAVV